MSLRQIAAINTRGVPVAAISSTKPKFEWVEPSKLYVEEEYQRAIAERSVKMIRKIVSGWDWAHIKPPVCVRDRAGRLVVIDGQHTAIAAVSHGAVGKIPIMVIEAKTVADRARAFVSQNKDRLALTPLHLHFAAVAAGDEIAVAVESACKRSGAMILKYPKGQNGTYKIGETFGIGVVTQIVRNRGETHCVRALKVLIDAKRAPMPAHEIAAVSLLLTEHGKALDTFDLATVIRSKAVIQWQAVVAKGTRSCLTMRNVAPF